MHDISVSWCVSCYIVKFGRCSNTRFSRATVATLAQKFGVTDLWAVCAGVKSNCLIVQMLYKFNVNVR